MQLVIARVLWPSFYFEVYDGVLRNQLNESAVLKITSRMNEYEKYLRDVFSYFRKYYPVEEVAWLNWNK